MPQQRKKASSHITINPASVWLDGLAPTGQRSMRSLLNLSAAILWHNATADSMTGQHCAMSMWQPSAPRSGLRAGELVCSVAFIAAGA